ncbi:hypothetical protein BKA69DRAFT_1163925 [Paraphysoderma sedebokerense]|nr:hypothetical protein BKA69DRAFT_1163925 [Paraphysoderma sedebokerense]
MSACRDLRDLQQKVCLSSPNSPDCIKLKKELEECESKKRRNRSTFWNSFWSGGPKSGSGPSVKSSTGTTGTAQPATATSTNSSSSTTVEGTSAGAPHSQGHSSGSSHAATAAAAGAAAGATAAHLKNSSSTSSSSITRGGFGGTASSHGSASS